MVKPFVLIKERGKYDKEMKFFTHKEVFESQMETLVKKR